MLRGFWTVRTCEVFWLPTVPTGFSLERPSPDDSRPDSLLAVQPPVVPTTTTLLAKLPRSPLPGERLHFQLQTVDLVSKVPFEEPVVRLGSLAASLSLAQSGCEPHELVIKTKAMVGTKTKFTNTK